MFSKEKCFFFKRYILDYVYCMMWFLLSIRLILAVFKCFITIGEEKLEDDVGKKAMLSLTAWRD